jgi:hypothetical protein
MFDASIHLTTGATSRTTSLGFRGTATFTSCNYLSNAVTDSAGSGNTPSMREVEMASAAVSLRPAAGVHTRNCLIGSFQVNVDRTIITADHLRRPHRHPDHQWQLLPLLPDRHVQYHLRQSVGVVKESR